MNQQPPLIMDEICFFFSNNQLHFANKFPIQRIFWASKRDQFLAAIIAFTFDLQTFFFLLSFTTSTTTRHRSKEMIYHLDRFLQNYKTPYYRKVKKGIYDSELEVKYLNTCQLDMCWLAILLADSWDEWFNVWMAFPVQIWWLRKVRSAKK